MQEHQMNSCIILKMIAENKSRKAVRTLIDISDQERESEMNFKPNTNNLSVNSVENKYGKS